MKYRNLNSLGRAYRNGEVDRSGYIRQRRELIDAITSRNLGAENSNELSEQTTVIRSAESLLDDTNEQ